MARAVNRNLSAAVFVLVAPLASVGGVQAAPIEKPSFCKTAKSSAERAICYNQDLMGQDKTLNDVYQELRSVAPAADFAGIRREQLHWLNARKRCGGNVACLKNSYADRISELEHTLERYAFPGKSHVEIGQSVSCDSLGSITSPASDVSMTLHFENLSGEYRVLNWIGLDGQPKDQGALNPGERTTMQTFQGHIWMLTDGPGNCIEMHVATPSVGQFNITEKSPGFGPE